MRGFRQRRRGACAAVAAGLAAALAGCWSAPAGSTGAGSNTTSNGAIRIKAVAQRYMAANEFKRISEYFDDKENPGDRVIVRTHPDDRNGYYFIIDLNWRIGAKLPAGSTAELEYITSEGPATIKKKFDFPQVHGTWPEIFLGLTGDDWKIKDAEIVAYKLTFFGPDGKMLTERRSFLWSLPPETVAANDKKDAVAANTTPAAATPAVAPGAATSTGATSAAK